MNVNSQRNTHRPAVTTVLLPFSSFLSLYRCHAAAATTSGVKRCITGIRPAIEVRGTRSNNALANSPLMDGDFRLVFGSRLSNFLFLCAVSELGCDAVRTFGRRCWLVLTTKGKSLI